MKLTSQTITKVEKIQYQGKLYNVTTSSGNIIVNGILCKNSGGLGTPANQRVVAGMIHKAHKGVLFIDEIATLHPRTQQYFPHYKKKIPIAGQSERSAGAMVRTDRCPATLFLLLPNMDTIKNMHRHYVPGVEDMDMKFMNETMPDTKENRTKIARFVAQELRKMKNSSL